MRVPRIFHDGPLSGAVRLQDAAANHIARVLRLKPGAAVILFNGLGGEYAGILSRSDRSGVEVEVGAFHAIERESPLNVTLLQGVSKGDRMEYAIQKATELGVQRIIPLFTERSVVHLEGERLVKRTHHWQSVAISACEQCGRNRIPRVEPPVRFGHWRDLALPEVKLVLDPRSSESPRTNTPPGALALLIGPEGGLSDPELDEAAKRGFLPVRLGQRILRTETATVAALTLVQSLWGDLL